MADVKIIDIDGVQWDMKDQEARNSLAELKEKTTVKITEKLNKKGVVLNLIEINDVKFLQLHFTGLYWSGTVGDTVATFTQDFGMLNLVRCLIGAEREDKQGRLGIGLDIGIDGRIKAFPQISNIMSGYYAPCYLYGDSFIKIEH